MRIAFLTSEFATDHDAGGLATYLARTARLLVQRGHEVEVFLGSQLEPRVLMHGGIRVERVPSRTTPPLWFVKRLCRLARSKHVYGWIARAHALAAALERRHRHAPFQLVQSADYLGVGLFVRRRPDRVHLVRCSSSADLYNAIDGEHSRDARWRERLERFSIRRADKAYAPSRFVAEHLKTRHGLNVGVVRPPSGLDIDASADPPCGFPERFLVHYGQLRARKGTCWLAQAFKRAADIDPSLRMVWAGREYNNELTRLLPMLGPHRSKVQVLHALPRNDLYALVQRADAAVFPSLVDNLPNTVIESLSLGIPVIGTRGASIDELVEPGVTGELVEANHIDALAAALIRMWRHESPARKGFAWRGGIADEMQPDVAIERLLQFARGAKNFHHG